MIFSWNSYRVIFTIKIGVFEVTQEHSYFLAKLERATFIASISEGASSEARGP